MSSTVPRHPGALHHPEVEGKVEVEAGDAAGCHPEEVAAAMEARPGVAAVAAAAVAVEGDVVAVAVAAALPLDDERA